MFDKEQQIALYKTFKKRMNDYSSCIMTKTYLISNMMAVYYSDSINNQESLPLPLPHHDATISYNQKTSQTKERDILIYWPYSQEECNIKTCIVDCDFERTNIRNNFHIVKMEVLIKHLKKKKSSVYGDKSSLLKFKKCTCFNHRCDLKFDWSEFIPYQFISTYNDYHHRQYSLSSSSSSSSLLYSSLPSSPSQFLSSSSSSPTSSSSFLSYSSSPASASSSFLPLTISSTNITPLSRNIDSIMTKYFINERFLRQENNKDCIGINIKPMKLYKEFKLDTQSFDTFYVFNNVIFQLEASNLYTLYGSEVMTLFSQDRLRTGYARYFSNHKFQVHPIACQLQDVSIKLYLEEGEILLDAVTQYDQHPHYIIVSQSMLFSVKTSSGLPLNKCKDRGVYNIYMPFQTDELDMSMMAGVLSETGLDIGQLTGNSLCIIETRENLHFKFDAKEKKGEYPFMIAMITTSKVTINVKSCSYELWTNSMTNSIPFNHLVNTITPYLSQKKRRRSSVGSQPTTIPIRHNTPNTSIIVGDKEEEEKEEDSNSCSSTNTTIYPMLSPEEVDYVLSSNTILTNEELTGFIDRFGINQYGSIFDFFKLEEQVAEIKSINDCNEDYDSNSEEEEEEEKEDYNVNDTIDNNSLPLFYLNDKLLYVKLTKAKNVNDPSSFKKTLYLNDNPLAHVHVDHNDKIISFDPVYFNNHDVISLIVY